MLRTYERMATVTCQQLADLATEGNTVTVAGITVFAVADAAHYSRPTLHHGGCVTAARSAAATKC